MPEDPMAEEVTVETSDEETADDAGEEFAEGGDGFVEDESGPEDAESSDDEGCDDDEDEDGAQPAGAGEEDDEDETDPDEVEADLNEILRDRIAADEDEEEEEDAPAPVPTGGTVERQDTELHCPHCFLLIQAKTVAETGECGHCGGPIR